MAEYYVTGFFNDLSLNFYNSNRIDLSLNKTGSDEDIYIAKYNSDGTILWARRIGGTGYDSPHRIVTDNTNVYLIGFLGNPSLNFYDSNGAIVSSLNKIGPTLPTADTYIAKYNSDGTFLWARQIGGTDDDYPVSIVTDNTNIYVTGYFYSKPLNFYNSSGSIDISLNTTDLSGNTFIAKYNSNGNVLWARQIGGNGQYDTPVSIVIDNVNLYIAGFFTSSTLKFYNSNGGIDMSLNNILSGNSDTYVAKYNSDGTFLWARQIAGTGIDQPVSIVTDNTNVYITGIFVSPLNFYNSSGGIDISLNSTQTFYHTYIAKYLSNGTLSWARQIAGTRNDYPQSVIIDNTNIYIAGFFSSSSLNFYNSDGGIDLSLNNVSSVVAFDTYIAKYLSNGTLSWVRQIGGTSTDRIVSLVRDNSNIYLTGYFNGSLNFYNSNGGIDLSLNNVSTGTNDTYIAKYNSDGTISWVRQIGGTNSDNPVSLVTDNTNIYLTGYFNSQSLNFYNSNGGIDLSLNNISTGTNDTYIAKYNLDGTISWARQIGGTNNTQSVSACVTIIQNAISNICFLKGTPILTDQGIIEIQNITNKNTINNKKVDYITQTTTEQEYLVCIEKNALSENIPTQRIVITRNHNVLYNGNLVQACKLPNIEKIKYNGEILYNVLLEENGFMNVNNLICETLDINNAIAHLYRCNKNNDQRIKELNNIKDKDIYKRKILEILTN